MPISAAKLQHTPGPWHVEIGPDRRAVRRVTAYDQSRAPYVAREVCDLPYRQDKEEAAAIIADARLIAAAPDLLEALVFARAWLPQYAEDDDGTLDRVKAKIRAAIAKAEG